MLIKLLSIVLVNNYFIFINFFKFFSDICIIIFVLDEKLVWILNPIITIFSNFIVKKIIDNLLHTNYIDFNLFLINFFYTKSKFDSIMLLLHL